MQTGDTAGGAALTSIAAAFTNTGTLQVNAGMLRMDSPTNNTGNVTVVTRLPP